MLCTIFNLQATQYHRTICVYKVKITAMAKQVGFVKIKGTIDELIFFEYKGNYFVKKKPDFTNATLKKRSASLKPRTKELISATQSLILLSKCLKSAMQFPARNYSRFRSKMTLLKNFDLVSPYGERNLHEALKNPEARTFLTAFNFNRSSPLQFWLNKPFYIQTDGALLMKEVMPGKSLEFPEGAQEMEMSCLRIHINFAEKVCEAVRYESTKIQRHGPQVDVFLHPLTQREAYGNVFYFLQLCFFRHTEKGVMEPLDNKKKDVLHLLAIDPGRGKKVIRKLSQEEILETKMEPKLTKWRSKAGVMRDCITKSVYIEDEMGDYEFSHLVKKRS